MTDIEPRASSDDCAPGQTCGDQGYCAAPGLACPVGDPDAPTWTAQ